MNMPTSQDEPALQTALVHAVIALLLGVAGSAGLVLDDQETAAISVLVAAVLAAVLHYVQGRITRGRVFAPATVEQLAPGASEPVLDVPINR
jgi:hypothetical protein